ncbi:MAG TPA: hemolysin family protein [Hyphomicrobiaceae bacterium]|jgi:putative hemolysin|nr:hemolysin family protein [Hyphomicrobiaceae bacterium]
MAVFEIAVVLVLIALNGLFALSELAVVSARRSRLRALAQQGRRGANRALALASDPSRFLSTAQIGITAVGLAAGAYSGATLSADLTRILIEHGVPDGIADWLAYVGVFSAITYLSLIIGELVPKNFALRNAESIACAVAPVMTTLSRVAAPAVWLLDISTKAVFWLLRQKPQLQSTVTEEEIKLLIAEAERAGVLETAEHRMISGVLRLGDRRVLSLMTPRTEVDWIDLTASPEQIRERILATEHSRVPVGEGSADALVGVIRTREPLAALATGKPLDLRSYVRKAPMISDTTDALDALEMLRDAEVPMALIHDEYGHFEGIVTPADTLEAIAGVFRSDADGEEPKAIPRDDGSWLLAGWMPADEMADQLGITLDPKRDYQTVAGFVLAHLRRLPAVGEHMEVSGWRFEVVDLDGRRVDKVMASRVPLSRRQLGT